MESLNYLRLPKGIPAFLLHLLILSALFIFSSGKFVVSGAEWSIFLFYLILFYIIPGIALLELLKWKGTVLFWFPLSLSFGFFLQGAIFFWLTFFNIQGLFVAFQYFVLTISLFYILYHWKKSNSMFSCKDEFTVNHLLLYVIIFSILWIITGYFGPLENSAGIYSHVLERHTAISAESMFSMRFGFPLILDHKLINTSHNVFFLSSLNVLSKFSADNVIFAMYVFWPLCYLTKMLLAYHIGKKMDSEILGLLFALFTGSVLFNFNLYYGLNYLFSSLFSSGLVFQNKLSLFHYNVVSSSHWLMLSIVLTLLFALKTKMKRNYLLAGFLVTCLMLSRTQTMMPFCIGLLVFMLFQFAFYGNRKILILIPFLFLGYDLYSNLAFGLADGAAGRTGILYLIPVHLKSDFNSLKYLVGENILSNNPNLLTLSFAFISMTLRHSGIGLLGVLGIIILFRDYRHKNNVAILPIHTLLLGTLFASLILGSTLFLDDGGYTFLYVFSSYFLLINFYAAWYLKDFKITSYLIIVLMLVGILWQPWMVGEPRKLQPHQSKEDWGTLSPIKEFDSVYEQLRHVSKRTDPKSRILWLLNNDDIQPKYSEKVLSRMATGRVCYAVAISEGLDKVVITMDRFDINTLFSFRPVDHELISRIEQAGFNIERIEKKGGEELSLYKIRRSL